MTLTERTSNLCIKIADWFAHPAAIFLFPISCITYIKLGADVNVFTLVLSILAISLTQMILRAQNVDAQATKLQIAELIRTNPEARNVVIKEDLTQDEVKSLKKEIADEISD